MMSIELLAKVRNLPFDRLRVNGLMLKLFSFSVRGELVEPQKNTFARGSIYLKKRIRIPCPGKRASGSPKKAVFPLSLMRASAVFRQAIPSPPRLFAEMEWNCYWKANPSRFCLRRMPSCRGNVKAGLNYQINER